MEAQLFKDISVSELNNLHNTLENIYLHPFKKVRQYSKIDIELQNKAQNIWMHFVR